MVSMNQSCGTYRTNPVTKVYSTWSRKYCQPGKTKLFAPGDTKPKSAMELQHGTNKQTNRKNPAYGRHGISRPMRIVAPIP